MLETEEAALKRGAKKIYGEVAGYGQTNDGFHILKTYENGIGILTSAFI
jgi:3-oxoacyl-(acyl-carrier-protein) synthase